MAQADYAQHSEAPGQLRNRETAQRAAISIRLPVQLPYDFDWVFRYLQRRALAGVEVVEGGPGDWRYRRCIGWERGAEQWVEVRQLAGEPDELLATIPLTDEPLHTLIHRIRRVFDLNADGSALHEFLLADSYLSPWVERAPGLRVPGAWDCFETAVRAVLGQQVSVERGTDLANRMVQRYGAGRFPTAAQLRGRDVAELGMPGRRGRAVTLLAELLEAGELRIDEAEDFDTVQARLQAVDGIGPWTANYIRMRALKDPDAFPDNDWVVLKELQCSAAAARRQAEAWRPWRAYALMYLWYAAGERRADRAGGKK